MRYKKNRDENEDIKKQFLAIFTASFQKVLSKKYENIDLARAIDDIDNLQGIQFLMIKFIKGSMQIPLFSQENEDDKYYWQKKIDLFRYIVRGLSSSLLIQNVLPSFKLEVSSEKILSLCVAMNDNLADIDLFLKEISKYIDNFEKALEIAESYNKRNEHLEIKYALCKTWENDLEWNRFLDILNSVATEKISIFIEGPLQLFLMISSEEVFIILKLITLDSLFRFNDKDEDNKVEVKEVYETFEYVREKVEQCSFIKLFQEILIETIQECAILWKKKAVSYRNEFVDQELRQSFIKKFESGRLFRSKD